MSSKIEELRKISASLSKKNKDLFFKPANCFENKTIGARYITGIVPLDLLVNGGFKKGAVVEIHGEKDSGKTSLVSEIVQRLHLIHQEKSILYVDAERHLTQEVTERYPFIDWNNIMVLEPESLEQCFEVINETRHLIDFIIIDSIPAMKTRVLDDKDMAKADMGASARQYAKGWSEAYKWASYGITVFLINQERSSMDQYKPAALPGGKSLEYRKNYEIRLVKSTSKANSIGLEKQSVGVAFGGEANNTKVVETPFANEVVMRFLKTKFGGIGKNEKIMYLKNRSYTEHENYKLFSDRPGSFLESISNYSIALTTPMIDKAGRFLTFYHPFTKKELKKWGSRKEMVEDLEQTPELYFLLIIGLYYYGLNENNTTNNKIFYNSYYTILKACEISTKIKYASHKKEVFFKEETLKSIDGYSNDFYNNVPLKNILEEKEYKEFLEKYGKEPWGVIFNNKEEVEKENTEVKEQKEKDLLDD